MPKFARKSQDMAQDSAPLPSRRNRRSSVPLEDDGKEKRQRGKDGCLTCRMRRKKCETQRSADGKCHTCTRLELDCLGFGNKRPEWMRDKVRLESERQKIKTHLVARGLVRGVHKSETGETVSVRRAGRRSRRPKSPESSTSSVESNEQTTKSATYHRRPSTPSSSDEAPSSTVVDPNGESDHVEPAVACEAQSYTESSASPVFVTGAAPWNLADISDQFSSPTTSPTIQTEFIPSEIVDIAASVTAETAGVDYPGLTDSYGDFVDFIPSDISMIPTTYDTYSSVASNDYFSDMTQQFKMLIEAGLEPQLAASLIMQSLESSPASAFAFGDSPLPTQACTPKMIRSFTPPPVFAGNQEDLIFYYFSRVSQMQYIYDRTSVDTMHSFITKNPHGPVASAIIALSSLHDARTRGAVDGVTQGHLRTSNSHQLYFNKAQNELGSLVKSGRTLTESEATAALHMVSWWLFQGGHQGGKGGESGWLQALEVACDWYEKHSGIFSGGLEPIKTIYQLNPEGRFAARTTMWLDIFSAITLRRPPRFSQLYDRLLRFHPSQSDFFLSTNGCCDEVMFCLSAIASLEYQKCCEEHSTLPKTQYERDLANGMLICHSHKLRERLLAIDCTGQSVSPVVDLSTELPSTSTSPSSSPMPAYPFTHNDPNVPDTYSTSEIFRQAALLYLSTVTSGHSPSVEHTREAIAALKEALEAVPLGVTHRVDRSLVFPICLAGCMTDDLGLRVFFSGRLGNLGNTVGNTTTALQLMEAVWSVRDSTGVGVAWRDVMNEMKFELLMV